MVLGMDALELEVLQNFPIGVGITDSEGKFVYVNSEFERMFRYDSGELIGEYGYILNAPSDEDPAVLTEKINASMKQNGFWEGEVHCVRKDGSLFWTKAKLSRFQHPELGCLWMGIQEDIGEKKSIELQLLQSQKMEAFGELAGGIAHEFNNLLAAMLGNLELILLNESNADPIRKELDAVMKATTSAAELVSQILLFARKASAEKKRISPARVVRDTYNLMRTTRSHARVTLDIAEDCGHLNANSTQLHQVCLNLVNNAIQSLPSAGGEVHVRGEKLSIADAPSNLEPPLVANSEGYFHLQVSDNGHGIPSENLSSIFEPFFTTKEIGEGTGLGLSIVAGIVKDHEGVLTANSEIGVGSTFDIYIPLFDESTPSLDANKGMAGGTENARILVVEDQVHLASVYESFLTQMGYAPIISHSGAEAFELFREEPNAFDLIFTDLELPEMDGRELIARIRTSGSQIPVLLATGFFSPETQDSLLQIGVNKCLVKPVPLMDLHRDIQASLAGKDSKAPR